MCAGVEINEDPIGLLGGENLFRYAANRPANARDSLGLDWRDDLIRNSAIVGSVIGAILGASGGGAGGTFCRRFAACLTINQTQGWRPGLGSYSASRFISSERDSASACRRNFSLAFSPRRTATKVP